MAFSSSALSEIEDLSVLLQDVLSPEKTIRCKAEERLDQLTLCRGFFFLLARYAYSNSENILQAYRLTALTILKQKIKQDDIDETLKVINILLNSLLYNNDRKIVALSSAIIGITVSNIEKVDITNPGVVEFFNSLINNLSTGLTEASSDINKINSLILISEILNYISLDSIIKGELFSFIPNLFQITISKFSGEISCLSVNLLKELILSAITLKKKSLTNFIKDKWGIYFPIFLNFMQFPCNPLNGDSYNFFLNKFILEILILMGEMLHVTKWVKEGFNANSINDIINCIISDNTIYYEIIQKKGADNDDDETFVIQQIIVKRWNLLGSLLRFKKLKHSTYDIISNNLESFLNMFPLYSSLRDIEEEEFLNEPNNFLRQGDEEEDKLVCNIRITVADVCKLCLPFIGEEILQFFFNILNSSENSWKKRESVLFLLEILLRKCPEQLIDTEIIKYNEFLKIILEKDVNGPTILVSRALSLLGVLLTLLKRKGVDVESYCTILFSQTLNSLTSPIPLLRVSACKFLYNLIFLTHINDIMNYFLKGQDALFYFMLDDTTTENILYISIKVYTEWISRCHSIRKDVASLDSHSNLFRCWIKNIQDPNIGELIVSLFSELIIEPNGDDSFIKHLSWISNILNGRCSIAEYCIVPFIIQILTCVFEKGSDNVAFKTADYLVGYLCSLLLTTEESSIISSASNCLAALLKRCPQARMVTIQMLPSIINSFITLERNISKVSSIKKPPQLSSLLEEDFKPYPLCTVLITIATVMLGEEKKEVSLMNSSKILIAIAENSNNFNNDEITFLIKTIIQRLMTVRTDTVIQELITPLATLLKLHMKAFINVIFSTGLLVEMFLKWLPKMEIFLGKDDIIRSCDALLELLLQWPPDERICGHKLPWVKGKSKKELIPLEIAIFVAIGKGVLNLISQNDLDEEESNDDTWNNNNNDDDDGKEEEEEEEEEQGEEEEENNNNVAKVNTETINNGNISHEVENISQKLNMLIPQYGAISAGFFSRNELKELSELLDSVKERVKSSAT